MQTTNINLKGVTRVPDDTACENGDLAIALNLAADGDGLKMLEQPQPVADGVIAEVNSSDVFTAGGLTLASGEEVLCVHQNDGYKHYITKYTYTENNTTYTKLCWWGVEDYTTTEGGQSVTKKAWRRHIIGDTSATQATVMGNTIITQGTTMEYWLWDVDTSAYLSLGSNPPEIDLQFGLKSDVAVYPGLKPSWESDESPWQEPCKIVVEKYTNAVPFPYWVHTHHNGVLAYDSPDDVYRYVGRRASGARSGELDIDQSEHATSDNAYYNSSFNGWDFTLEGVDSASGDVEDAVNAFSDAVMGPINKYIADKANEEGKFIFPFFIRYCYELYDGSQVMQSDPVLLVPSSRAPSFIIDKMILDRLADGESYEKVHCEITGRVVGFISKLHYSMSAPADTITALGKWKDLIKSIGIYITPGIYTYDQAGKVYGWKNMEASGSWDSYFTEGKHTRTVATDTPGTTTDVTDYGRQCLLDLINTYDNHFDSLETNIRSGWCVMRVPEKSLSDIKNDALNQPFYKLTDIPMDDLTSRSSWYFTEHDIDLESTDLTTLTNHRKWEENYVNTDKLSANVQYIYNRRLHLADVSRMVKPLFPFRFKLPIYEKDGGTALVNYDSSDVWNTKEAVIINNEGGDIVAVSRVVSTLDKNHDKPLWLYCDNPEAKKIIVQWHDQNLYLFYLTKHPTLNGCYWLSDEIWTESESSSNTHHNILPNLNNSNEVISDPAIVFPTANYVAQVKRGEVWTSNVENPFVFQAGNVNQVGDGVIKALRAAVAPLAEDQHGYAPMYVFTSQGVWAMTFSKDGTPAAIDHICGDIITEGTEPLSLGQSCLVMTDRGLLGLAGRSVRNLSAKIDGEFGVSTYSQFQDYANMLPPAGLVSAFPTIDSLAFNSLHGLANCKMAYDYKHQRVYVFTSQGSWVLNLRTGLWTQSESKCKFAFNAYPSCEWVNPSNKIVSLDGDTKFAQGLVMTRPIKFGEWQQKFREVAVRGFINPDLAVEYAQVWTALHGSRDWHKYAWMAGVKGDRLTHLGGSGYRSNIVSVILRSASATVDRLVISHDTEQGDRLR